MNHLTVSNFKLMKVAEIREQVPFELTADGTVIAVVESPNMHPIDIPAPAPPVPKTQRLKCPNCKGVYDFAADDGKPYFFTLKHP